MTGPAILKSTHQAWSGLSMREQGLIRGSSALVLAMAAWFLILQPSLNWRGRAEANFVRSLQSYETTLSQLDAYQALSAREQSRQMQEPLRTLTDRLAREHRLAINRIRPFDDGRLEVWMQPADADAVITWLTALSRDHGVHAEQVSLDRESQTQVRVQVLLRKAGGV